MIINTANQTSNPYSTHIDNTINDANSMTSLSSSELLNSSKPLSKSLSKSNQKLPSPPPNSPQQKNDLLAATSWRLWAMLIILMVLSVWSSWALINQAWARPFSELFTPSSQLDIASMATQLHLVATSIVALLAGGLLGVVVSYYSSW